jgi:RNA polymerase sigma factor (sigma-70 family)
MQSPEDEVSMMKQSFDFPDLIHRVRAGDEQATAELCRQFEPFVRRFVRFRMLLHRNVERLRRMLDSSDICQSVLISLCEGLRDGRFDLSSSEQLEKVLCTMARLKIATQARKPVVTRRMLSNKQLDDSRSGLVDLAPGPEREAAGRDLLEAVMKRFSNDEFQLLVLRDHGQSWAEIAAERGGNAEALRKKLERAVKHVRGQFDLEGLL